MSEYHEDAKCGSCSGPLEVDRDAICHRCTEAKENWQVAIVAHQLWQQEVMRRESAEAALSLYADKVQDLEARLAEMTLAELRDRPCALCGMRAEAMLSDDSCVNCDLESLRQQLAAAEARCKKLEALIWHVRMNDDLDENAVRDVIASINQGEQIWVEHVSEVADRVLNLDGCCDWETVCDSLERQAKQLSAAEALISVIDATLRVPAAEYVPAIQDVFTSIDLWKKEEAK